MHPFKRILIPTDFSLCAEAAFRHARHLAQGYEAEAHLLHIAPQGRPYGTPPPAAAEAGRGVAWPDRIAEAHAETPSSGPVRSGLLRREIVHHADPPTAILDYAQAHAVDLIVLGAHGDRGAGHFLSQGVGSTFLGKTAEQVVRHAACPVFRVGMRSGRSPELVQRILVSVDLSPLSLLALAYARSLAALYDARLEILQVLEEAPSSPATGRAGEAAALEARARAELVAAFERAEGPPVPAGFHVVRGRPEREIRGFVKRYAIDLVVLGAHSDGVRDALGSVAEQVVRAAPCPVFTVRQQAGEPRGSTRYRGLPAAPSFFL